MSPLPAVRGVWYGSSCMTSSAFQYPIGCPVGSRFGMGAGNAPPTPASMALTSPAFPWKAGRWRGFTGGASWPSVRNTSAGSPGSTRASARLAWYAFATSLLPLHAKAVSTRPIDCTISARLAQTSMGLP